MNRVCVLIPAHNEDRVISATLASASRLVPPADIYVVDDGSTDSTSSRARAYTPNVLTVPNRGKATALNAAIRYFRLPENYQYILFLDADTLPQTDFLLHALKHFSQDSSGRLICVVGRVKGLGQNWISRYRQWEYLISHSIHKTAQANLDCIIVVPGCATLYLSRIFRQVMFPVGTMTEDMDFTFQLHRRNLGRIEFEPRSVVYVQDPQSLSDFIAQISRWYRGFWQVVRRHQIPWGGQTLDLEVAMLGLEGLYNGFIVLAFLLSFVPVFFMRELAVFKYPALIDLFLFFLPTLIWSAVSERNLSFLIYLPHFYFLRFLSSLIFIKSFFTGFSGRQKEYTWNSRRY